MFQNISIYEQLTALPYLPAYKRLIEGAIELDVFSQLEEPVTAADLAQRMGWHEANTLYLLQGLNSIDYVKKTGDAFQNAPDTSKYLVKGKPEYTGNTRGYHNTCSMAESLLSFCGKTPKTRPRRSKILGHDARKSF